MRQRRPRLLNSEMLKEADRTVAMDSDVMKQMPPNLLKTKNWPASWKTNGEVKQIRDAIKRSGAACNRNIDYWKFILT